MALSRVSALLVLAALGPWAAISEESCTAEGGCTDGGGSELLQDQGDAQRAAEAALEALFKAKTAAAELARAAYDRTIAAGKTANSALAEATAVGIAKMSETILPKMLDDIMKVRACPQLDHSGDLDRNILDVRAEHPGEDLFCHFAKHVPWFGGSYTFAVFKNYVLAHETLRQIQGGISANLKPDGAGPLITYHMEGLPPEGLTAHSDGDNYIYDDVYCYQLGFLQNMGVDGKDLYDYDAWRKLAQQWCEKAGREFDFADEELTVRNHVDLNPDIWAGAACVAGLGPPGCKPVTRRMFILHAYQKCLLGDEGHDLAYCHVRGCLLGNHVGHFAECD